MYKNIFQLKKILIRAVIIFCILTSPARSVLSEGATAGLTVAGIIVGVCTLIGCCLQATTSPGNAGCCGCECTEREERRALVPRTEPSTVDTQPRGFRRGNGNNHVTGLAEDRF